MDFFILWSILKPVGFKFPVTMLFDFQVRCKTEIPSRLWRSLSIGISTVGLVIVFTGFGFFLGPIPLKPF